MTLNADIPPFEALMRREYLYDLQQGHGEFVPVVVFGVSSLLGRALGFHVMTDTGAMIWRLPISALAHKPDAPVQPLDHLQLWDCFSYELAVTAFTHLAEMRCATRLKDGQWYPARYRFTVDWYGSAYAESPGDTGHKCAHILALDNGNFAAQPNNRICWHEPSFVTRPFISGERPDYRTNTHVWKVENTAWQTEDSDRMFYEVECDR